MRRDVDVEASHRQAAPERHLNWCVEGIYWASYWVFGPVRLSVVLLGRRILAFPDNVLS